MNGEQSRTLYLECNSGISGDMTVAALLDLGADEQALEKVLVSLPVEGFTTKIRRVKKAGLDMCDFEVLLDQGHENHDHDMRYLHGHVHEHAHACMHEHDDMNAHESHHIHAHRGLADILHIIRSAHMTPGAKHLAEKIFRILAAAEAKAHGVPEDQVHFHEVGAVDSIVDIIAAAVCLDNLGIDRCIVPALYEGCGTVRCQHGVLPIPVPAVANIASEYHLRLRITDNEGEFVTPTGAAIAAAMRTDDMLPDLFIIEKTGMGAGKREYKRPSILRAMLIRENESAGRDEVWKLESNIDDCTGETLGYVMERLFEAGARDVHYIPVYMKKNRPAWQLNVICRQDDILRLEKIVFEETTTIGIRRQKMQRSVLERRTEVVHTSLGDAKVKICCLGAMVRKYPEYDSVAMLCRKHRKSFQEVYQLIVRECNDPE